jgi:hypothetical protein
LNFPLPSGDSGNCFQNPGEFRRKQLPGAGRPRIAHGTAEAITNSTKFVRPIPSVSPQMIVADQIVIDAAKGTKRCSDGCPSGVIRLKKENIHC